MRACLSCDSGFLALTHGDFTPPRRPFFDAAPLADFGTSYALARERNDAAALLDLGRKLGVWLDGGEGWLARLRRTATPPLILEIRATNPDAQAWAVLHAPWELLADEQGFLAADERLRYAPARRLGTPTPPPKPDDHRLGVAFMASAPRGQRDLDFEAEEAAILSAARQNLDLFVEESGDPDELGARLVALDPSYPVLHLSCHGHNAWKGADGKARPVLMMEDPEGAEHPVWAEKLIETLGDYKPRLVFLSACLTAAAGSGPEVLADSLATGLVRSGVPAVIGWDGSVADIAATAFAQTLYDSVGRRRLPLEEAVAATRRALLNDAGAPSGNLAPKDAEDKDGKDLLGGMTLSKRLAAEAETVRRDWHMARLWLGPAGGGALVGGTRRRSLGVAVGGAKTVLLARADARLEVANPDMFVGRRRELQRALRRLRDHGALLLHGMGRLGKSSLAARIADRRPDLTLVVVHGHYDALSVVDALRAALVEHEVACDLLDTRRAAVAANGQALDRLLVNLLAGPCREAAAGGRPILLLIDDLEQILEPDPKGRHRVRDAERPVLSALLRAFTAERGDSRLLFTSRFPFTLPEGGRDLAATVAALELGELTGTARRKLALRQARAAALPEADLLARLSLLADSETLARGNPGLQDLLGANFALQPGVPVARAQTVLAEMTAYLDGGALPATEDLRVFLQNLALDALLDLAGESGQALIRTLTLFQLPVPDAPIEALAAAVGGAPGRLRDLGLLVLSPDPVSPTAPAWSVNGLAAGRQPPLTEAEQRAFAADALPALFATWTKGDGNPAGSIEANIELTRLGLLAANAAVVEVCAAYAVRGLGQENPAAAGALGQAAITLLEEAGRQPSLILLSLTAEALQTSGHGAAAETVLAKGSTLADSEATGLDEGQLSNFLFRLGNRQAQAGSPDAALATFERLRALEIRRGDEHQVAVATGSIADIFQARGDLDGALRIREREELPVFTRLGDVRSIAVTQGKIADILEARGDLDGALRIRREETLPVFTRLGDVREIAVTQGKIADILEARGDLDGALRIREREQLPVYTRLGDVRSIAVTQSKIADILQARGDLDGALRIREREQLPVYTRLGDVRSIAVTQSKIADILQARGDLDGALRIREREQLPVYTRLGDVRSIAVTQGKIAHILMMRSDLEGALALQEQRLATNRQMGDIDGIAAALWDIAQIHLARENLMQAFEPLQESWQLFLRLGRAEGLAVVGALFGQFLAAMEQTEAATQVFRQSEAAYRKLRRTTEADQVAALLRDLPQP